MLLVLHQVGNETKKDEWCYLSAFPSLKPVLARASVRLSTRRRCGPRQWPQPRGGSIPPGNARHRRRGMRGRLLAPWCTVSLPQEEIKTSIPPVTRKV